MLARRYASIDLVCDRLTRKLRKVKDKAIAKGKWQGRGGPKGSSSIKQQEVQHSQSCRTHSTHSWHIFPPQHQAAICHLHTDFEESHKQSIFPAAGNSGNR